MNHKKEKHFKQKLCKSFHGNGYCRFSDDVCIYIHNQSQASQRDQQTTRAMESSTLCWHGQSCSWLKMNTCKFNHTSNNVTNATQLSQEVATPVNTNEIFMKTIIERLERIEKQVPNVKSMEDFPKLSTRKKSQ